MLISVVWNPGSSFDGFYRWYQYVLFGTAFITLAVANRNQSVRFKLLILYSVVGITVIYTIAAMIIGRRPFIGPFVNPNYYASYLLVGFSAAVAIVFFETVAYQRIFAGAAGLLLYYGMTQAWSRGATVSAIAVVLFAIVRFSGVREISRVKLAAIILVILTASAIASPILLRKFIDRGSVDPYNYQRPKIWLATWQVIRMHPLFGIGPGEFYYVSKRYSPPVEGTVARYLKRPAIAHSEYLQEAAEGGIPAALIVFGLGAYLFSNALRRARKFEGRNRLLQEAAILAATGVGLHALVDNNWTVPVLAASMAVFTLGDILPLREWHVRLQWSLRLRFACISIGILMVIHGILLPGIAVSLNESGQAAYNRQDLDRAESLYRLSAALCPNNSVFLNNAGVAYFDKFLKSHDTRWLDFAETLFVDASKANPNSDNPGHQLERLLLYRLTGDPQRDRPVHLRMIQVDRDILRIDPVNPFVRKNLAEALYNVGDREGAAEELNVALQFEPNYVPAYLRLAEWFREAGDGTRGDSYRQRGVAVAMKYRNERPSEMYESLLLGRPQ
jgi:O-antigen ligase